MDDRQIMYTLTQKKSKVIDGIINSYSNNQTNSTLIKKGLNYYFFNKHNKYYPKSKEWKKFINTKGLYEYFSLQNKIIDLIFTNWQKGEKIEENKQTNKQNVLENINNMIYLTKNYIYDSKLSYQYENERGFLFDDYLFEDNDLLNQREIYTTELKEPTKKEKDNISRDEIVDSLINQTRKYYDSYNDSVEWRKKLTIEKFLDKINFGEYTKDVRRKIFDDDRRELQKIIDSDDDRKKDIEEYNRKNANRIFEELSTNYIYNEDEITF